MTYLLIVSLDIVGNHPDRNPRFKAAVKSVKHFSKPSNKVVVIAHRGQPRGRDNKLSLKVFTKYFYRALGKKVKFLDDTDFKKLREVIEKAPNGSLFLLENTRFFNGETGNSSSLAKKLAFLGDRLINDDFPTAHRINASNVGVAKLLPSVLGPSFKAELRVLEGVVKKPSKPSVLVLGGAKTEDKLGVMKNLLPRVDNVLLGGAPANTMLAARGVNIGRSLHDKSLVSKLKSLSQKENIITPVDWRLENDAIYDIGPYTEDLYREVISGAKTIIWNGPMGMFEKAKFAKGTRSVAQAVLQNKKAKVVIGGGDTLSAIGKSSVGKNVHISTGGGSMLTLLSGKELPAVKAIN